MPPKGTKRAKPASNGKGDQAEAEAAAVRKQESEAEQPKAEEKTEEADDATEAKPPASKRAKKEDAPAESNGSSKKPASERPSTRSSKPAQQKDASKVIQALLSDDVFKLLDKMGLDDTSGFKFPRDRLNPFQELVAALMVSKPFSHVISSRAVTELFHDGKLKAPKDIIDMGEKAVLDVLWKAKTLHKDKQAAQIIGLAEACQEKYSEGSDPSTLDAIRCEAKNDVDAERDAIVSAFKGYGPKTVDIFFRRVQVDWEELYPFADDSTLRAAQRMGLPDDAEGLQKAVAEATGGKGGKEERVKFARVCDMLVYLGLENKLEAALESV